MAETDVSTLDHDGMTIRVYRHKGKLIVEIDTAGLTGVDRFPRTHVPNIRIRVNEQGIEFCQNGKIIEIE